MGNRDAHPATLDAEALLHQCRIERTRRSGPGGQHRNKVETAIVLHHEPTGTAAEASERRSQKENQRIALQRLRLRLATHHRRPLEDGADTHEPSPLWRSRLKGGRIVVSATHADFPALLAEAMDVLAACEDEPAEAAARLGCSTSQLIKLLKLHPPAFAGINRARTARGRHALK